MFAEFQVPAFLGVWCCLGARHAGKRGFRARGRLVGASPRVVPRVGECGAVSFGEFVERSVGHSFALGGCIGAGLIATFPLVGP